MSDWEIKDAEVLRLRKIKTEYEELLGRTFEDGEYLLHCAKSMLDNRILWGPPPEDDELWPAPGNGEDDKPAPGKGRAAP
jgi:hypothetical protein